MKILDHIEQSYERIPSKAKLYDGTVIECTVYSDPKGEIDHSNDKPPTERYIQIMTEGAAHYKVDPKYIEMLNGLEQQPRRKPDEFEAYELPEDAPTMTLEEMMAGTGKDGGPIYCSVNGKVLQYLPAEEDEKVRGFVMALNAGKQLDLELPKLMYDPKYGMKDKVEDMTPEHLAYVEDTLYSRDAKKMFKAIAKL